MAEDSKVAQRINGLEVSRACNAELAAGIAELKKKTGKDIRLAVILVGTRGDSQTYVRMKVKTCNEVGIQSVERLVPETATEAEVLGLVTELNRDPTINGILVQLPLPRHMDADKIIQSIDPAKDVDGLHEVNLGQVARIGTKANLISCTPLGVIELLDRYKISVDGKHAVVLGRSNLVGKPLSLLLLSRNATVTTCHSKTADLPSIVKQADILVSCIGKALFVKGDWLKPGCVVIDVGTNPVPDSTTKSGYRLKGDVDFEAASKVASFITPVPGGVGPMTVAMLMRNTVTAFQVQNPAPAAASPSPASS